MVDVRSCQLFVIITSVYLVLFVSARGADEARLISTHREILVAEIDRRATLKQGLPSCS